MFCSIPEPVLFFLLGFPQAAWFSGLVILVSNLLWQCRVSKAQCLHFLKIFKHRKITCKTSWHSAHTYGTCLICSVFYICLVCMMLRSVYRTQHVIRVTKRSTVLLSLNDCCHFSQRGFSHFVTAACERETTIQQMYPWSSYA